MTSRKNNQYDVKQYMADSDREKPVEHRIIRRGRHGTERDATRSMYGHARVEWHGWMHG